MRSYSCVFVFLLIDHAERIETFLLCIRDDLIQKEFLGLRPQNVRRRKRDVNSKIKVNAMRQPACRWQRCHGERSSSVSSE